MAELTAEDLLHEIDEYGEGLTPWEIEFVESMTKKLAGGMYRLSDRELERLRTIWEERVP